MNILHIPKKKLRPIVESIEMKGILCLPLEHLLAIIWSYRKQENGMYYSNEQLADLLYVSERSVKNLMKAIKQAGLVNTVRRYNMSSIIKPSEKFYQLMEEKGTLCPTGKAPGASYTSSKEEEDRNKNEVFAFLDANPHFKKAFETQSKSFGEQKAIQSIKTILNKTTS